jgi:hypothetical protein
VLTVHSDVGCVSVEASALEKALNAIEALGDEDQLQILHKLSTKLGQACLAN